MKIEREYGKRGMREKEEGRRRGKRRERGGEIGREMNIRYNTEVFCRKKDIQKLSNMWASKGQVLKNCYHVKLLSLSMAVK